MFEATAKDSNKYKAKAKDQNFKNYASILGIEKLPELAECFHHSL